jgi:hypothetical protein
VKAISASIITQAGAVIFAAGATVSHGDTQLATCAIGSVIGVIGLGAWFGAITKTPD